MVTTAVKVTGTLPSAERADVVNVVSVANSEWKSPTPVGASMTAFTGFERSTMKYVKSPEGGTAPSGTEMVRDDVSPGNQVRVPLTGV